MRKSTRGLTQIWFWTYAHMDMRSYRVGLTQKHVFPGLLLNEEEFKHGSGTVGSRISLRVW